MTTTQSDDGRWPTWDPERAGFAGLAPYATTFVLPGLNLMLAETHVDPEAPDAVDQRRALVEQLWQLFVSAKFRYNLEPWSAEWGQRIRDARAVRRSAGTCLDVALLFAAMSKAAGLRPYVVVLQEDLRDGSDHAMVVVDLESPASDIRPLSPAVSCCNTDEPDVYVRDGTTAEWTRPGTAVAVDVVRGLSTKGRPMGVSFADACASGEELLLDARRYATARLVDVIALHSDGKHAELGPEAEEARPTIYPKLPPSPAFVEYPSRQHEHERLRGLRGLVVLHGESGVGKSMLAGALARSADEGCGWFLDASSKSTLTASLAEAELAEQGGSPAVSMEPADLAANATAALQRLARAEGSWVVVLDNADGDPSALGRLPEVKAHLGQLLLVTTTNAAWRNRTDPACFRSLRPLDDDDVRAYLDPHMTDDVCSALAGRPLLMSASRRFREATGEWWWTSTTLHNPEGTPLAFWRVVDERLDRLDAGRAAKAVARAVAWLPPLPVDTAVLTAALPGVDVAVGTDLLHHLGVVERDRPSGLVQMHRLLRTAVRADWDGAREQHLEVVRALLRAESIRSHLASVPDLGSLEDMRRLLGAADAVVLHTLATLIERHNPERAAIWFTEMQAAIPAGDLDDAERRMVCDGLRGRARVILRDTTFKEDDEHRRAQLDDGIDKAGRAWEMTRGRPGWDDRLAASRAEAMLGVLQRQRGGLEPDPREALTLLLDAGARLRHSAMERAALYVERDIDPATAADVDRSEFNLAGLAVRLAQKEQDRARQHLAEADDIYGRVGALRLQRYGTEELEEVVCCTHGAAIVAFYRAVLLPGTAEEKFSLLRTADGHSRRATEHRTAIAGAIDDSNTAKSTALSAKIQLARFALQRRRRFAMPSDIDQFKQEEGPQLLEGIRAGRSPDDGSGPQFDPVGQVGAGRDLVADIARWITEPPIVALVAAFGGDPAELSDPAVPLRERLAAFDRFTDRWDTRVDPETGASRERNQAEELLLDPEQARLALAAARAIGMMGRDDTGVPALPRRSAYDHVVLLGGLVRACLNRTSYAARLIADGLLRTDSVVAVGGYREFRGDEFQIASAAGHPGLSEEFQALDFGARTAFELGEPVQVLGETSTVVGKTWGQRHYQRGDGMRVVVAAAPSTKPGERRADTADSLTYLAKLIPLEAGQNVLIVTSSIYANAQQAHALRTLALPHQVSVETVGSAPAPDAPRILTKTFNPTLYLLEIRSSVRALYALLAAAEARP